MAADEALSHWLLEHLGLEDAYVAAELAGGNSNITLLVESAEGRCVLRRPPANTISPLAARGVRREFDVLLALNGAVRAPRSLAFCDDPAVVGAPFAVFSFVPGISITESLPAGYAPPDAALQCVGEELVDALGELHRLPWQALDLPGFTAPPAFLLRQIERWVKIRRSDAVRELPLFDTVARELSRRIPRHSEIRLMHGDYHLDNTLFHEERPELAGVIDWELATLGDPLADLGLLLAFWGPRKVAPGGFAFVQAVTRSVTAPSREALADRWSRASGVDVVDLPYYCAFALWRLAAVVEGAYVLYRRGRVTGTYARGLEHDVPRLLEESALELGIAS